MVDDISRLDYFAAQALTGLLMAVSNPASNDSSVSGDDNTNNIVSDARESGWESPVHWGSSPMTDEEGKPYSYARMLADESYSIGRAMLAESRKWNAVEAKKVAEANKQHGA